MVRWMVVISTAIYLITQWVITLPVFLLWIKYIALAIATFSLSAWLIPCLMKLRIGGKIAGCLHWLSIIVLSLYAWVCLDTFLMGMKLPLSGMLRYGLFDFYPLTSLLFILLGGLYGVSAKEG